VTDRSNCPICGDWRDSPTADCANCGWAIRPCGDALGLCIYAGRHDGPHKFGRPWAERLIVTSASKPGLPAAVHVALTDEDEIAHGEAVFEGGDGAVVRTGKCAYDGEPWPCRTQRGIDRLLARLLRAGTDGS
jgi:hypothetical protein